MKVNIKAAEIPEVASNAIIGKISGEALDTNITNKNGLDISREVIENVIASDDYKEGIAHRWFIGFLGHPEDPNCMDFKDAGIIMTDMRIEEDGKVYADFDIVDTPVGQIIKKFTEAGVEFGISIRGAGDIVGSEVDPDTFIFRGYDVVTFPAYPESIPKFDIAASTDTKYQKVCAAVEKNAENITSASALKELRKMFSDKSDVAKTLDSRIESITSNTAAPEGHTAITDAERLEAMTDLYLKASAEIESLRKALLASKRESTDTSVSCRRKTAAVKRIMASQMSSLEERLDRVTASCSTLRETITGLRKTNEALQNSNLIYKQRVDAASSDIEHKDQIIASLQSKLRKTVTASSEIEDRASNLDEDNRALRDDVNDLEGEVSNLRKSLHDYQDAYASMYAASLGVDPDGIQIDDNTSVIELCQRIESSTGAASIPAVPAITDIILDDPGNGVSDIVSV